MISQHTQINLGLLDKVDECLQPPFSIDLGVENLAVFGNKFSGKSTLLKSIIIQIHNRNNTHERIVIIDFGRSLLSYNQLPLVYGYFSGENEENIKRCLNKVEEIIKRKNASADAIHYTFIIDGIDDLFLEGKYERHQETFMNILRKKAKGKMSIIFTSYHSAGGVVRLLQFFDNVIAFDLPKEKYEDLFPRKVEKPMVVSGRGIARKGESAYEFQAYYPFANKEHEEASEKSILSNITKMYANFVTDKIKSFADELTETEYSKLFSSLDNEEKFVAGVDYVKFEPIKFDLHDACVVALYGTCFEDKLNLVQRIILHAKKLYPDTIVSLWDDSRSRFKDGLFSVNTIIEDSESFEAIFTPSLHDDILNITKYNADTGKDELQYKELTKEEKFNIYIIQNSRFFSKKPGSEGTQFAMRMCSFLQEAARLNYLFIFTNIKPIQQGSMLKDYFNGCIKHAFLCGDIFQFIDTRGRSSVFGDIDSYELKQDFSRTVQGDGFYLDDESDYPQKIKFIVESKQVGGEKNDRNS